MNHHHHHEHEHDAQKDMTIEEKLEKLVLHWIKHNEDHAETYTTWMKRAQESGLEKAGKILAEAADLTLQINEKLRDALK